VKQINSGTLNVLTHHYLRVLGCFIRLAITSRQLGRPLLGYKAKTEILGDLNCHPAVQRRRNERMRRQQDGYPYDSENYKGPSDASQNKLANQKRQDGNRKDSIGDANGEKDNASGFLQKRHGLERTHLLRRDLRHRNM
jgi:hypothetical protein